MSTTKTQRIEVIQMNERIKAIENLLRILAKNHEIVIKSDLPTKDTIDVVDFIRQFSSNLQIELATYTKQASDQAVTPEVIDTEKVLSPSVGNDTAVAG